MDTRILVTAIVALLTAAGARPLVAGDAGAPHTMPAARETAAAEHASTGRARYANSTMHGMQHGGHGAPASEPDRLPRALARATDGGTFFVELVPEHRPPPFNDYFTVYVKVYEGADRDRPATDVRIAVDAGMRHGSPGMAHGMHTAPEVSAQPDGSFRVEGMLFHMRGPWILHVDVSRGGARERATFRLDCCAG